MLSRVPFPSLMKDLQYGSVTIPPCSATFIGHELVRQLCLLSRRSRRPVGIVAEQCADPLGRHLCGKIP